jgi:outer membrane murein-binding lipoprotein Lpp
MKKFLAIAILSCSILLAGSGCGKKADETKPMDQVKAEAQQMNADQLHDMALKYKDAITAKTQDIQAEAAKLKEIPVTQMLGDKAKQINAEVDKLKTSVSALKDRMQVYVDELKKKGGNISDLSI